MKKVKNKITIEQRLKILELNKPGYLFSENYIILDIMFEITTIIIALFVFGDVLAQHGMKQTIETTIYGLTTIIILMIHTYKQIIYTIKKEEIKNNKK